MYTDQQYEEDKLLMTKQERFIQERFEKIIDVLILYKQNNPKKDVYLSDECINEAVQWFHKNMSSMMEKINN